MNHKTKGSWPNFILAPPYIGGNTTTWLYPKDLSFNARACADTTMTESHDSWLDWLLPFRESYLYETMTLQTNIKVDKGGRPHTYKTP